MIRPWGTSTSSTPRKENRSFTRYVGGSSETWRTTVPNASVTAAWKTTEPPACLQDSPAPADLHVAYALFSPRAFSLTIPVGAVAPLRGACYWDYAVVSPAG